ncbi:hypothetical protein P43SY_011801 [Pythium insidiosum]|uniref:Phosphate acetyl/butaryl transferase domain-containing protein n=1 Tax=Pythium insidiosum TaxID=114742 RepID=A0AAD5Q3A2_PYTIN|nr:hypothetical protein P43SY_011801 [Pythium insidiosum]
MLQGLRKPVNDLSRGATVKDIVTTVAITAIQADQIILNSEKKQMPTGHGTLRFNMDPFNEKNDAELWDVLKKGHLYDVVQRWGCGLEYEIAE